jgi:hypothetical protein
MKRNPLKEQPIPAGLGKILLAHLIPDAILKILLICSAAQVRH